MASDPEASQGALAGRVVFLTGAVGGIGSATARLLRREGALLALADRDPRALAALAEELGADATLACPLDIRDAAAVEVAVNAAAAHFGRLDGAVNNAAIQLPACPLDAYPLEEFRRVIDINLMGTAHCLMAEIRAMLAGGRAGSIVNLSSGAGVVGLPGIAPYIASKAAVLGLTRAAAVEYGARGIRVNAVSPGMVPTPMTAPELEDPGAVAAIAAAHPIGRLGRPQEIAETIAWLLGDDSVYVLGANIAADGGYTAQ